MRYMLTLANVHNDDLEAEPVEEAAGDGLWGEVYPEIDGQQTDPVEVITRKAVIFDDPRTLRALLDAAEVGLDGVDDQDDRGILAGVLADLRAVVV